MDQFTGHENATEAKDVATDLILDHLCIAYSANKRNSCILSLSAFNSFANHEEIAIVTKLIVVLFDCVSHFTVFCTAAFFLPQAEMFVNIVHVILSQCNTLGKHVRCQANFSLSAIPGYDLVLPRCQLVMSCGAGVRLRYIY